MRANQGCGYRRSSGSTTRSADEIQQLTNRLSSSTQLAVDQMDRPQEEAEKEAELNRENAQSLNAITGQLQQQIRLFSYSSD